MKSSELVKGCMQRRMACLIIAIFGIVTIGPAAARTLQCNDSLKAEFKPNSQTTVLFVKHVKKGDPFPNRTMEQLVYPTVPARFEADLCWVKLLVGPGNPGPANAPSTSRGVGIEVWLPEKGAWNHRFVAIGGSGWANGTEEAVLGKISSWTGAGDTRSAPRVAAEDGAVTSTTDSGYPSTRNGSFLMSPDGSINRRALKDWNYRALYDQAVITKDLARAYYGLAPEYSYFDGASGGGRQAFAVLQRLPTQYNGILASVAALNWYQVIGNLYPSIVIERDLLGRPMSGEQLALVSNRAIAACDVVNGRHLGFILHASSCRYDPTKDVQVLCRADGGTNATVACVTRKQALAIDKFWYGITKDGSVPDPAVDNGWGPLKGAHLWYGLPRGADLSLYIHPEQACPPCADTLALVMKNVKLASTGFNNATGNGENDWIHFSYAQLAAAFEQAKALQPAWEMSANEADVAAFRRHGGKIINVTHMDDNLLWPQGAIHYYESVVHRMGGLRAVQSFYRLYLLPGVAHGDWNGTMNPAANPPVPARRQMYNALADWVEKGTAPSRLVLSSSAVPDKPNPLLAANPMRFTGYRNSGAKTENRNLAPSGSSAQRVSLPVCPYPEKATYVSGDIYRAVSYECK